MKSVDNDGRKKKNYIIDHSDCYLCSTVTPPPPNLNLEETQDFFYNQSPSKYLLRSTDPLLSQSAAPPEVDECGIYPPDVNPTTNSENIFKTNGLATTTLPLDVPSPLYCTSNEFTKLISRFQSLLYNLELSVTGLSCNSGSREKISRELNSLLNRLQKLKDQTLSARKKFDKLVLQVVNSKHNG